MLTALAVTGTWAPTTSEARQEVAGRFKRALVWVPGYGALPARSRQKEPSGIIQTCRTLEHSHRVYEATIRGAHHDPNPMAWVTGSTAALRVLGLVSKLRQGGYTEVDVVGVSFGGLAALLAAKATCPQVASQLKARGGKLIRELRTDQSRPELDIERITAQISVPEVEQLMSAAGAIRRLVLLKPALDFRRTLKKLVPKEVRRKWKEDGWLDISALGFAGLAPYGLVKDAKYWSPGRLDVPEPDRTWAVVGSADERTPPDTAETLVGDNIIKIPGGKHDLSRRSDVQAVQQSLHWVLARRGTAGGS